MRVFKCDDLRCSRQAETENWLHTPEGWYVLTRRPPAGLTVEHTFCSITCLEHFVDSGVLRAFAEHEESARV